MPRDLVILAAGAGSRYGGPKQLAPVGPSGEALLEYSVFDALRAGFGRVVLVIRAESEADFRRRFETGMARRVQIEYVHQSLADLPDGAIPRAARTKPWGTGHAVLAARHAVDGPFGVINADDLYGAESYVDLAGFLFASSSVGAELALVGFPVAGTLSDAGPVSRAVCEVDGDHRLRRIVELTSVWREDGRVRHESGDGSRGILADDALVSLNMWGFVPAIFAELERRFREFVSSGPGDDDEFQLPGAIQGVVEDGVMEVRVLRGAGRWSGLTYGEDASAVAEVLATRVERGDYPAKLWE